MTTQEITPKEKQEATEAPQTKAGRYYVPDVDIREDADALWLWADIPGVKQENIAVDVDQDILTLRGDVTLEDYEGLTPVYTEYNVGNFVRRFPELRGTVTDLLIGDLFTDRVDKVWQPMESLYAKGKTAPERWDSPAPKNVAENKANELILPAGHKP